MSSRVSLKAPVAASTGRHDYRVKSSPRLPMTSPGLLNLEVSPTRNELNNRSRINFRHSHAGEQNLSSTRQVMTQVDRADCALSTLGLRRQGVVRALEMMRLRLADQMSLEYLAKTAAMSRFHFERVFHQITGLPPFVFLSAMRLVRARELVLSTDESITAICFNVGYNSVGTFTRRFTASVGISPRRLRSLTRNR